MPYYFYDYWYFVLVVPAFLFALWAQYRVKSVYGKMSRVPNTRGLTGAAAAARVLYQYGVTDVRIEQVSGRLSDHYDPRSKVIRLSEGVYSSTSVAAVGIACHEAGHAAQHAENYLPIKLRNLLIPVCNVGSTIGLPLAILGFFMGAESLVFIGICLYGFVTLFQLATLPVEFNASNRAVKVMEDTGMLQDEELQDAKKVLRAAAMTYVASLAVSLANLLRLILRFSNNGRR